MVSVAMPRALTLSRSLSLMRPIPAGVTRFYRPGSDAVRSLNLLYAGIACLAIPLFVFGQSYPSKPIHVIVPLEPGGAVDIAARRLAPRLQEDLGQPIII